MNVEVFKKFLKQLPNNAEVVVVDNTVDPLSHQKTNEVLKLRFNATENKVEIKTK